MKKEMNKDIFKEKKNILTIISSPNTIGGTPQKTLCMVKNSIHNHSVYFYSKGCDSSQYSEYLSKFESYCAYLEGYKYERNVYKHIKKIIKYIDQNRIEVVQCYFFFGELLGGIIKTLRPKVKLVISFVNNIDPSGYKRTIESWLIKKADKVIYISKSVKAAKESCFPVLKKKDSRIIYNGAAARQSNNSFDNKFRPFSIVYTAGLIELKNHSVLIEAAEILINRKSMKNIFFHFIGDGPLMNSLKEKVEQLDLANNIIFWGYNTDIGSALENCQLYVHPCYNEGFGIAVTEAMIKGKPVIVSDKRALPELVENGIDGFIAPAFDAEIWAEKILFFIKNPESLKNMGINAEKNVKEKFSLETFVKNHDELYAL